MGVGVLRQTISLILAGAGVLLVGGCAPSDPGGELGSSTSMGEPIETAGAASDPNAPKSDDFPGSFPGRSGGVEVSQDYWAGFESFEPVAFGRSSDTPLKLTETRVAVPHQDTAVVVTVRGGGKGELHISPAGPNGEGLAAFFDHVGERMAPNQVQLALNIFGDTNARVETLVFNTTWEDWSAIFTPVADLPFLREAGQDEASGGPGGWVFRSDGLATQLQVNASEPFSVSAFTQSGEEIPVYGQVADGSTPGHILVPEGAAWVSVVFESDWDLTPLTIAPLPGGEIASRTLVDAAGLDPQLVPVGVDGYVIDRSGYITGPHPGEQLPIDTDSLWIYLVPQVAP